MGEFHLDADWDRDGRLTGRPGERAARTTAPGAILLANLDVAGRRLPTVVKAEAAQALDRDGSTQTSGENDVALVEITAEMPTGAGAFTLSLLIPDTSPARC